MLRKGIRISMNNVNNDDKLRTICVARYDVHLSAQSKGPKIDRGHYASVR